MSVCVNVGCNWEKCIKWGGYWPALEAQLCLSVSRDGKCVDGDGWISWDGCLNRPAVESLQRGCWAQ